MDSDRKTEQSHNLTAMESAFVGSSKRSRYINIVIIFASVLAFTAYWNSRHDSWLNCRDRMAAYILNEQAWLLARVESTSEVAILINNSTHGRLWIYDGREDGFAQPRILGYDQARDSYNLNLGTLSVKSYIDTSRSEIDLFSYDISTLKKRDSLRRALEICRDWDIETREAAIQYSRELRQLFMESILVIDVPILGFSFDINDLNIFAGFAFCVILLWFRFSLWKELTNIEQVFRHARPLGNLSATYKRLAMQQVLTVPRIYPNTEFQCNRRLWSMSANLLFCLPLIIHGLVIYHDFRTFWRGVMTNQLYALLAFIFGVVFLMVLGILTYHCWVLALKIDRVWDDTAAELEGGQPDVSGG